MSSKTDKQKTTEGMPATMFGSSLVLASDSESKFEFADYCSRWMVNSYLLISSFYSSSTLEIEISCFERSIFSFIVAAVHRGRSIKLYRQLL